MRAESITTPSFSLISAVADHPAALHILSLSLLALFLTWPLLIRGVPDQSHDGFHHARWAIQFATQFWHGELYPRWYADVNGGYGGPSGFFYPPLENYVSALFWPFVAARASAGWLVVGYSVVLGAILSGIAAYFWLRSFSPPGAAFFGAAIYLIAPYHLAVDVYMRGAVPEFWTFAWLPLVLLSVHKLINHSKSSIPLLAVSFALAVLSHPTVALCFAPVPLALVLFLTDTKARIRNAALLSAGLLLGVALSAVYLAPAFMDQQKANTSYYHPQNAEPLWLVQDSKELLDMVHYAEGRPYGDAKSDVWNIAFNTRMLGVTLSAVAVVAALFFIRLRGETQRGVRSLAFFWFSAAMLYLFLMTKASWLVWVVLPALKLLQFAFRLNIMLVISIAALSALAYPYLLVRRARVLVSCLAVLLLFWLGIDLASFRHTFSALVVANPERVELYRQLMRTHIDPPEMWPRPGNDAALSSFNTADFTGFDWLVTAHPPKATQIEPVARRSSGSSRVVSWRPRHVILAVEALRETRLLVNHFYYSGWTAHIVESHAELPVRPTKEGLIAVNVPRGSYHLALDLPRDSAERMGLVISTCALLLLTGYMLWLWRSNRKTMAGMA